jgi:TonB family protein
MTIFIGCTAAQPKQNGDYKRVYEDSNLGIGLSQDMIILGNEMTCKECDSLYNRICSESSEIFGEPEKLPVFPGGEKEMMKFLKENLKWPTECTGMGVQGRVIVRFIISETGEIICPKIQRSLHPAMDEEALRVINLMPNFVPASNNGIPIKMCYTLPVLFKFTVVR